MRRVVVNCLCSVKDLRTVVKGRVRMEDMRVGHCERLFIRQPKGTSDDASTRCIEG